MTKYLEDEAHEKYRSKASELHNQFKEACEGYHNHYRSYSDHLHSECIKLTKNFRGKKYLTDAKEYRAYVTFSDKVHSERRKRLEVAYNEYLAKKDKAYKKYAEGRSAAWEDCQDYIKTLKCMEIV